ncbi:hypothetical protein J1N35_018740 [Gossypium stocksii]|uniref:CCHC-type domain-containing protein n=1 Tax=Gossypium stocksii TaxID=47602 RepID=A0A9D3VR88_9ROSI|nr:hypothetical protein J1N35_018740 [Gossypium stocksii]
MEETPSHGIFVSTNPHSRFWNAFKYEKLLTFCFSCGKIGHGLQDCKAIQPAGKDKVREDPPFFLALKTELNVFGRESVNALSKKSQSQWLYLGSENTIKEGQSKKKEL